MQYRQYGKDGPLISRLGFGVMRLPAVKQGDWGSVDFPKSVALLRAGVEAGVNFLDTHHGYHHGKSETAIGLALKGWKGQRIYIQTKTPWYREEPEDFCRKRLYEALEKLGVNCIDYYFHHSLCWDMWRKRGRKFIKFTDWAINRGLIRYRGASVHDGIRMTRRLIDLGEFPYMLMSYNYMNPALRDTIQYAAEKGVGMTIMNPIGGGSLAAPSPQIMRLLPGAKTAAEVALRYVLDTPGVVAALSGMNTMEHLKENVAVASRPVPLTAVERKRMLARLDAIASEQRKFCTACGYCMPCKHGVDIPGNFQLLNRVRFFGQLDWAKQRYKGFVEREEGDRSAAKCVRCGECEPKCPNKVPICASLVQVAKMLGGK